MTEKSIEISNNDYWFKVVDMLQQNWALIESKENEYIIYFIGDKSGIFDQMSFYEITEAQRQLRINGFRRYEEDSESQKFIVPPHPPFHQSNHPNGAIYSSGRYWKEN